VREGSKILNIKINAYFFKEGKKDINLLVSPSLNKAWDLISQQLSLNVKERLNRDLMLLINGKSINILKIIV